MNLIPELIAKIRTNSPDIPASGYYDLLVSMAGFSPQTTAQAYLVLLPKKMHILCSSETSDQIDRIWQELHSACTEEIKQADVSHDICDPTDPLDIYRLIKNKIAQLRKNADVDSPFRVVIDMTGGKKVMSATA
ncbi:MAG: hypothetical protein LBV76_02430, partial [Deltaproteobacteria bacterium]|nr:hypothetical protein [Deltaproteobacteria bacterium]